MVSDSLAEAKELTSGWGWFLAAGIAWVIFGFVVLSFNMATVWAIAVFFGIGSSSAGSWSSPWPRSRRDGSGSTS